MLRITKIKKGITYAPYSLPIVLYHGPKRDIVSAIKNPKINSTKFSTIRALLFGYKFYSRSILPIPK